MNMYLELTFSYYFCVVKAGSSRRRLSFQIRYGYFLELHIFCFTVGCVVCFTRANIPVLYSDVRRKF